MRRTLAFTAVAAALAVLAEVAGTRLDPGALRTAAPVALWLVALLCFSAPRRVPASDAPDRDPVEALADGVAAASGPRLPGAFVGVVLPGAALVPAWCAAARWFGAPGDVWPLAALGLAASAAGGLSTSGRAVGAFGALLAASVALGVGPDGWARALGTGASPAGSERPAALLGVTLSLEGPLVGAEVGYPGLPSLAVDAHLAAGESVTVQAPLPGPAPLENGELDPLAREPSVRLLPADVGAALDGDAGGGAVRVTRLAPPAPLDAVAGRVAARARPPAREVAAGGGGGRGLAGALLLLSFAAAALGATAVALHAGPLRGATAALLLSAGVGLVPADGGGPDDLEREAPAHVVHEGQRLADGGAAWWTVRRVALPARVEADDIARLRALEGARAPRCRIVVRGGEGAAWLLPPAARLAAVDLIAPAEELRFAVLAPEVNALADLEEAWWRGADGAVEALGAWRRGAPRPGAVPGGSAPPDWAFAGAPIGREGVLGRLEDGSWVRLLL